MSNKKKVARFDEDSRGTGTFGETPVPALLPHGERSSQKPAASSQRIERGPTRESGRPKK